jgi:site-specific DNA recombinase
MWIGGNLPSGYDVRDRELVVNEAEAATVKYLFQTYAELEPVSALMSETRRRGIVSKLWTSSTGNTRGGAAYSRGALYYLLRNPLYVGRISHRGATYTGLHPSIVPQDLWDTVQAMVAADEEHECTGFSSRIPVESIIPIHSVQRPADRPSTRRRRCVTTMTPYWRFE